MYTRSYTYLISPVYWSLFFFHSNAATGMIIEVNGHHRMMTLFPLWQLIWKLFTSIDWSRNISQTWEAVFCVLRFLSSDTLWYSFALAFPSSVSCTVTMQHALGLARVLKEVRDESSLRCHFTVLYFSWALKMLTHFSVTLTFLISGEFTET